MNMFSLGHTHLHAVKTGHSRESTKDIVGLPGGGI